MPDQASVEISSNSYPTYISVADADIYLAASSSASATWTALDADQKAQNIVTASRLLDSLSWKGDPTEDDQDLAWPRTGTGVSGVEDDEIPQAIVNAAAELAGMNALGVDIMNFTSTASIEKRIKAGSVEVENFRSFGTTYPFPLPVWRLLAPYLGGPANLSGVRSSGTDGCSITNHDYGHSQGF